MFISKKQINKQIVSNTVQIPKEFPVWSLNWLGFASAASDRKPQITVASQGYKFLFHSSECRRPGLVNVTELVSWSSGIQVPAVMFFPPILGCNFHLLDRDGCSRSHHRVINPAYRKKEDMPLFLKVCPPNGTISASIPLANIYIISAC